MFFIYIDKPCSIPKLFTWDISCGTKHKRDKLRGVNYLSSASGEISLARKELSNISFISKRPRPM